MEWQRNVFSWETLPETIHRAWCTCLCILNTEIACGYFCKTNKACAALGWTESTRRLPLHPGRAGAPQLGRSCSSSWLICTAELSQAASSLTAVLKIKKSLLLIRSLPGASRYFSPSFPNPTGCTDDPASPDLPYQEFSMRKLMETKILNGWFVL